MGKWNISNLPFKCISWDRFRTERGVLDTDYHSLHSLSARIKTLYLCDLTHATLSYVTTDIFNKFILKSQSKFIICFWLMKLKKYSVWRKIYWLKVTYKKVPVLFHFTWLVIFYQWFSRFFLCAVHLCSCCVHNTCTCKAMIHVFLLFIDIRMLMIQIQVYIGSNDHQ